MIESFAQIWLLILLASAAGLPIAALADRRRSDFWLLLFEGVAIGVVVIALTGLALVRWFTFAPGTVLSVSLAIVGAAWIAALRLKLLPPPPRFGLAAGVGIVILLLGTLLRARPVHFIYQVGDFGQYIGDADQLVEKSAYPEGFLPLFTVIISTAQLVVGPDDLTVASSVLGVLLIAASSALLIRLGVHCWGVGLIAGLVALGALPTWFGSFPATETLYAFLLVTMLYFTAKAVGSTGVASDVAAVVLLALALSLTRGNAVLLGPLLVIGTFALAFRLATDAYRRLTMVVAGALSAVWCGALYAIRYHNNYFVETQLSSRAPESVLPVVRRLDEPAWALVATALVVALLLSGVLLLRAINRRLGPGSDPSPTLTRTHVVWGLGLVLFVLLCGVAIARIGHSGLTDGISSFGPLLLVLAAAGAVTTVFTAGRDDFLAVATFALIILSAYSVFYASQFPAPLDHAFYRYWHRYLFSEAFPMAVILAGIGAAALLSRGRRIVRHPDLPIAGGAALLLAGSGLLATVNDGALARQHVLFEGDYQQLEQIDSLLPEDVPVLYDGLGGFPGFPNSYRAFGAPLRTSFDRVILNEPTSDFGPDPRVSAAELAAAADEYGRVSLLSVGPPNTVGADLPDVVGGALSAPESVDISVRTLFQITPTNWRESPLRAEVRTFRFGPPTSRFISFGPDVGSRENEGATGARWALGQPTTFTIELGPTGRATLILRLRSFLVPRKVQVLLDGNPVGGGSISSSKNTPLVVDLEGAPGRHTVALVSDPPPQSISESLGTADDRSVALRIIEPIVVR